MSINFTVVGEPLNREAFDWYHDVIGNKKADVVDTWWQTGTHLY